MAHKLIHSFAIKLISTTKVKRESKSFIKVGRKCQAVVILDDKQWKARLTTSPVEDERIPDEFLVLPFTDSSLSLKGKTHVFLKEKDKYGHYICVVRDKLTAKLHPGLNIQYNVFHEGLLISGYIVKKKGKHYFEYEELIAFTENGAYISKPNLIGIDK